jgi:hypothetical protein
MAPLKTAFFGKQLPAGQEIVCFYHNWSDEAIEQQPTAKGCAPLPTTNYCHAAINLQLQAKTGANGV